MDDSTVYKELYAIVCQGDLSNELDTRLKSMADVDQTLLYFYHRDGQYINLLMLAALHGHDAVVHVILSHISDVKNLVELLGNVIDIDGKLVEDVSALWCACARGYYTVARTLIEIGRASVDFSLRCPLLIDAVVHERLDTVQFLIENDYVDIDRTKERDHPNYNSLMLSAAHGQIKTVAYLLKKGAEVNYKTPANETALGCAAMHGYLDIVQLLCSANANADIMNRDGETPLILAFENDHFHVVNCLMTLTNSQLCIEELELIVCSIIVTMRSTNNFRSQFEKMVNLMGKIFRLRKERNSPKHIAEPIAAYNFHQECQTIEEFEGIQQDNDRLYIEALLIRERILFPKKTIALCEALHIYGEKLVKQGAFEHCLHLWEHTFHLYQNIGHETGLHRFVWVFCKMLAANVFISPELFLKICRLIFEPSQQTKENNIVKNALCLVTIAVKVLEQSTLTKIQRQPIYQWIIDLCHQQRTTSDGQTLLHLCVNDKTYHDINYHAHEIKQVLNFPNFATAQLLLTFGNRSINLDAIDISTGNTALHIVCQSTRTNALSIVELLINAGAHVDYLNKHNKTPFDYTTNTKIRTLLQERQAPSALKCLCARHIVTQHLNYELSWPLGTRLNTFIYLHGAIEK